MVCTSGPFMTTSNLLGHSNADRRQDENKEPPPTPPKKRFSLVWKCLHSYRAQNRSLQRATGHPSPEIALYSTHPRSHHLPHNPHPSATEQWGDSTMDANLQLNARGWPKCEAAKGVSAYLKLGKRQPVLTCVLYFVPWGARIGRQHWAGSGQWGGGGGGGGGGGSSRPATQPPSHPATQPPCHLATQPSSHIALGLALLHFASLPLLSRLHDDDVSLQQVLVQFPCTYVCHVCVIR